jgi:parallel beta-helix repeat protein
VSDNIIGMTWNKSNFLPNNYGIEISWGNQNVIGSGNVIAGNSDHGVYVYHADDNLIYGNYIGYPFVIGGGGNDGDGVHVHASANNTISKGNVISENGGNGIYVNGSAGTVITGNGIGGNTKDGIHMKSSDGQIGDSGELNRNGIGGNGDDGIHLDSSSDVTIKNNYIGLDSGAFDAGNQGHGILVENGSSNNTIGGEKSGEGNWIGWNQKSGIYLSGSGTQNNYILRNVLGAPINWGWEAPNGNHGVGVYDGANDNWIGGLGIGNTIIASGWSGVAIVESSYNHVLSNRIGTNGLGITWGNAFYGVHVVDVAGGDVTNSNAITFNEIAYNGTANGQDLAQAGVKIEAAVQNPISQNSIHHNDGPGIQLFNGGNTDLPSPTISQASCKGPVKGKAGGPGWTIEIFSDTQNEGRYYEGQTTADTHGDWSWSGTLHGPNVTATARTPANDTSPFSSVFPIERCLIPRAYLPLVLR